MSPKAKHTIEEQETIILDAAVSCIEESSLMDFTMSDLSKKAGLSMGSIYKHIQTKEDVLVALATRMFQHLHQTFAEIFSYPLTMPERQMALLLLSPKKMHCFSFGMHLDMMIGNEAILNRASTNWISKMIQADKLVEQLCMDQMVQACADGELKVTDDMQDRILEEILVGMWSMDVGYFHVALHRHSRNRCEPDKPLPFPLSADAPLVSCAKRFLNTYPWRNPLDDDGILKVCALLDENGYR